MRSILEKCYFPLYGGEVIICSCVSSHCYVAVLVSNFTIKLLVVHLGWLSSLCAGTETCQLERGKTTAPHADAAMADGFFSPLKKKKIK